MDWGIDTSRKVREIGRGPLVREMKGALRDAEVVLDKPENTPEVVTIVVKVSR
jgi:hypothetical protein